MQKRASASLSFVASLGLWLAPALALADPLEIGLKNQVPAGQKPSLELHAVSAVRGVQVQLTRQEDGRAFTVAHGALRDGQKAQLAIGDGKPGHFHWKGKLSAELPDGNRFSTEMTFETATLASGLQVRYSRDHLDLDGHVLEFQLTGKAGKAELTVVGDDGSELGRGAATYAGEPPGTWLKVPWTQRAGGNVLRLELRAVDAAGNAVLARLTPWQVRIPHEEVNFPSGSAQIPDGETGKLDASYGKIIAALERARAADPSLPVRLYIAGHTDTVGGAADNRTLSLARARAIGAWFRDRGLPLPVACAGFGEDALKVKTPDNTDEAQNRRADYIVGVEEPVVAKGVKAGWATLK